MVTQVESTDQSKQKLDAPSDRSVEVDKEGARVRDMFAQIAPRYDLMNHVLSLGIDIRWRKRVMSVLRLDGDEPVLDCCTGTGDLALMIAQKLGQRAPVMATDFCPQMLDLARKKQDDSLDRSSDQAAAEASELAFTPIQFIEADSQALPFDDDHFQAVTVAFGLRNVQDTDQGIREMIRVCRPGGQVCILEFSKPTAPGLKQLYGFYFRNVLPRIGQTFAKNNQGAYEYLPNSVVQFPSGQELVQRLESHGLKSVKAIPMTCGVATIYFGDKA